MKNAILNQYLHQKIKEVILYILDKTGDISYFQLMKVMFCAERNNLMAWGEPLTSLDYYAKKHGPVPEKAYRSITAVRDGRPSIYEDIISFVNKYEIRATRRPDMNYLSKSDVDSIDKAITELSGMEHNDIENYLNDDVYNRVFASKKRLYNMAGIAESAGADCNIIARINENQNIQKALV